MPAYKPHVFINGIEKKWCCLCDTFVPIDKYWKAANRADGYQVACKDCCKRWKRENKEIVNRSNRKSKRKHRDKIRIAGIEYRNKKYRTDPAYKTNVLMALGVRYSLKGNKNGARWTGLVGYSVQELMTRLKKTMPSGYCWDDYLSGGLQIDHIIPVTAFNITSPQDIDFKRCWALKNLRLLPAEENLRKRDTVEKPFQPSLALAV